MAPTHTFDSLECKSIIVSHLNPSRAGVVLTDGYLDNQGVIEFWDDFMGSNASEDDTEPGYPWSTKDSDNVNIRPANYWGGVWELKTSASEGQFSHEMHLFANPSFKIEKGKSLHFKARFLVDPWDSPSTLADNEEGFFIGLTSHEGSDFFKTNCDQITGSATASSYGLLFLSTKYDGEYSVLGVNHNDTFYNSTNHDDDGVGGGGYGMRWNTTPHGDTGVSVPRGPGTTMTQGIVFEMNINCDNSDSNSFTVSYILKMEKGVSGGIVQEEKVIKTGVLSSDTAYSGQLNAFKYENQRVMAPAVYMRSKNPEKPAKWYIDYIHCVQKR
tara:strand:- start:992 stop:1975 length:984 start_codon:yes stop_codon:yes gene_type:complete